MKASIWFVTGSFSMGLLVGFMTGLSISPITGTVMGLVFAFAGGSVVVLIKGRDESELLLIGKGLSFLSVAMIIGIVSGIVFRTNGLLASDSNALTRMPFSFNKRLDVQDIIKLHENKIDPYVIKSLLRTSVAKGEGAPVELKIEDIEKLTSKNVNPYLIAAMFDEECLFRDTPFILSEEDIVRLVKFKVPESVIIEMMGSNLNSIVQNNPMDSDKSRRPVLYDYKRQKTK